MGLEARVTRFLQGNALLDDQTQPDDLGQLIQGVVPKDQLNTTRVLLDKGVIYLSSERESEVNLVPASPLPREKGNWLSAWRHRQEKIEERRHGPKRR